jgi:hypothetical protein
MKAKFVISTMTTWFAPPQKEIGKICSFLKRELQNSIAEIKKRDY